MVRVMARVIKVRMRVRVRARVRVRVKMRVSAYRGCVRGKRSRACCRWCIGGRPGTGRIGSGLAGPGTW